MKKLFAVIAIIIALLCCLPSCGSNEATKNSTSPPPTVSDGVHFGTVSDLLSAIKYDPYNYIDKEVEVRGTLCKLESETLLFDYPNASARPGDCEMSGVKFRHAARTNPNISIAIPDEIMHTVAESGDYITVSGTVKISDGKIYLDNCTYSFNS